jgi:hypothetical protein
LILPFDGGTPQRLKTVHVSILSLMRLLAKDLKTPSIITIRQSKIVAFFVVSVIQQLVFSKRTF